MYGNLMYWYVILVFACRATTFEFLYQSSNSISDICCIPKRSLNVQTSTFSVRVHAYFNTDNIKYSVVLLKLKNLSKHSKRILTYPYQQLEAHVTQIYDKIYTICLSITNQCRKFTYCIVQINSTLKYWSKNE